LGTYASVVLYLNLCVSSKAAKVMVVKAFNRRGKGYYRLVDENTSDYPIVLEVLALFCLYICSAFSTVCLAGIQSGANLPSCYFGV
jgi:hypothetical protein